MNFRSSRQNNGTTAGGLSTQPRRKLLSRIFSQPTSFSQPSKLPSYTQSNGFPDFLDDEANQSAEHLQESAGKLHARLPIDWSLKTQLRFTCSKSLAWSGQFRALEDALGITSFVRCFSNPYEATDKETMADQKPTFKNGPNGQQQPALADRQEDMMSPLKRRKPEPEPCDTSRTASLRKHSLVWMYPRLPWLKMFPRDESSGISSNSTKVNFTSTLKSSTDDHQMNGKLDAIFKDPKSPHAEQLLEDWRQSLHCLFHLVQARQCAFFYICGSQFTVLVRAAGVAGIDNVHALVSNSSVGLRKMLKEDGIEFTMPFMDTAKNGENGGNSDNGGDNAHLLDEEEDSNVFLESLGLSQQDFPSMKSSSQPSMQKEDKQKTLLYIKGKHTNLFLTFLSNTNIIIPTIGSYTGIPPTLLSPVAFTGSSLHSLKLKASQTMSKNGQLQYNLDLIGPIMPNLIHSMSAFLRHTISEFRGRFTSYTCSNSFAKFLPIDKGQNLISLFATENLKDCGLSRDLVNDICKKAAQSKDSINDIHVGAHGYRIK